MNKCEFCNDIFKPRPQVKNPRACDKPECQQKRQSLNEKEWREKNQGLYDGKYHSVKRVERKKTLDKLSDQVFQCIKVGKEFLNQKLNLELVNVFLVDFFHNLGIRCANKLWSLESSLC